MHGKAYVSSFVENGLGKHVPESHTVSELVSHDNSSSLTEKIVGLYGACEVHFVTDSVTPQVVEYARAYLDERQQMALLWQNTLKLNRANMRRRGYTYIPDKAFIARLPEDLSTTMSPAELTELVEDERTELQALMAEYSDKLLSLTLHRVNQRAQRSAIGSKEIAQEIKGTIVGERSRLHEIVQPWRGVITIERDFSLTAHNRPDTEVDMRVLADRQGKYIKAWVPATKEWDEPMGLLCSAITEVETMLALQDWVMERQLPYLPVAAPLGYERGKLTDESGKSTRADLLLCSLLPERNEIIPVQVKNTVTRGSREKYHPREILVEPADLGLKSLKPCLVEVDGARRTGLRAVTQYGSILERYLAAKSIYGKGHKVPKKVTQAYSEALQPAFDYFDRVIMQEIQNYGSIRGAV